VELLATTPEYRLVEHLMGTTRVPLKPRRIVSLSNAATDGLAALGIRPILVQGGFRCDGPSVYLKDQLKGVAVMPWGSTLSLEAVLAARPDLIFAGNSRNSKYYSQLSKIAPTVCLGSTTDGFRQNRILDVGEVLGMRKQARRQWAAFHRELARAKALLASRAKNEPVAFLRFRKNTCVIYTRTAMFGPLLFEQLGLTPDPAMPMVMSGGGWDVLSIERLSELQAEHLFVTVDPDSELYLQGVAKTPIWRNIPAVRHRHVHRIEASTWLSGDGLLGSRAIVHDVLAGMVPKRSP
jgi:iron complex transport system substrate-binding protein